MTKKILLFFILIVSLFVLSASELWAGPLGITITPSKYVVEVKPGDVYSDYITVINPNDFTMRVKSEYQDFKVSDRNEVQWVPAGVENPFSLADWINIDRSTRTLKPKGEVTVPFTIKVPKDAAAGGHYGAIFFVPVLSETGGDVGSVPRVGALIILNVAGDIKKTGELVNFRAPLFVGSGPVVFKFNFLNTGTTHYEVKGKITIRNLVFGKTEIDSEKKFVYPNINRDILAKWDKANPFGIYWVKGVISDGAGNQYTKHRIMFALPIKIFLPILLILVILYWAWKYVRRKFKIKITKVD